MKFIFIYITSPDKETALKISKSLVKAKLVACTNIIEGMTSVYEWEGKLEQETEVVLFAKTREDYFDKVVAEVEQVHPYDVPCILSLPIQDGNSKYLKWLEEMTRAH